MNRQIISRVTKIYPDTIKNASFFRKKIKWIGIKGITKHFLSIYVNLHGQFIAFFPSFHRSLVSSVVPNHWRENVFFGVQSVHFKAHTVTQLLLLNLAQCCWLSSPDAVAFPPLRFSSFQLVPRLNWKRKREFDWVRRKLLTDRWIDRWQTFCTYFKNKDTY